MKMLVLSDHASDQLRKREAERQARYHAQMEAYEDRLQFLQSRIDAARAKRRSAWEEKQYLRATLSALVVAWRRHRKAAENRAKPVKEGPSAEDCIWREGQAGEDALSEFLGRGLTDEWTLIKGYKNPKREMDAVLAGPHGIFCVEVKNYRGTISCDGNSWTRDKSDSWGNLVSINEPITDRGARSPAMQVNEPANLLSRFLAKATPLRTRRYVVFTSPDAEFGVLKNLTLDGAFLLRDWRLEDTLRQSSSRLTPREVETIVQRIERDHRHWEERRRSRAVKPPAGRPESVSAA